MNNCVKHHKGKKSIDFCSISSKRIYGPANDKKAIIAYAQRHSLNVHAKQPSVTRWSGFGTIIHACTEGPGVTEKQARLALRWPYLW